VKFLVDNQLPVELARFLTARGHDAVHVLQLGMDEADDQAIWRFASMEQRAVISKDEDFLHLANRPESTGLFIWIRLPNCRKHALLAAVERVLAHIVEVGQQGPRVVEVR